MCIGCASESGGLETKENTADSVEGAESQSSNLKAQTNSAKERDVFETIATIKQQVENRDYSRIEDLIIQKQTYLSKNGTEENVDFPQLSHEVLVEFFNSVNLDSLMTNGSFEKKYAFASAPEGYEPDSEECPDLLVLSIDNSTKEVSLLLRNSFVVNEDIGCAESATIYLFKSENRALRLEKVGYAG